MKRKVTSTKRQTTRAAPKPDFWEAYQAFRQRIDLVELDISPQFFEEGRSREEGENKSTSGGWPASAKV